MTTDERIEALALRLAAILRDWLTPDELAEVRRRNAAEPDEEACASHDFCDANEAMAQAWAEVIGPEIDVDDEAQRALWSGAWDLAKMRL